MMRSVRRVQLAILCLPVVLVSLSALRHRHGRSQGAGDGRVAEDLHAGVGRPGGDQQRQRPDRGRAVQRQQVEVVAEKSAEGRRLKRPVRRSNGSRSSSRLRRRRCGSRPRLTERSGMFTGAASRSATRSRCRRPSKPSSRRSTAASSSSDSTGASRPKRPTAESRAREIGGPIEAITTNGGVDVELTRVVEPGVKLECTNGGIKLRLPADAKATISASVTNGGIDADGLKLETHGVYAPAPGGASERRRTEHQHRRHQRRASGSAASDTGPVVEPGSPSVAPVAVSSLFASVPGQPPLQQAEHGGLSFRQRVAARATFGRAARSSAASIRPDRRRASPDGCSTSGRRLSCCPAAWPPTRRPRTMFLFACASESNASNSRSSCAASTVPAHVRKSFDVKSWPVISLQVRVHF